MIYEVRRTEITSPIVLSRSYLKLSPKVGFMYMYALAFLIGVIYIYIHVHLRLCTCNIAELGK